MTSVTIKGPSFQKVWIEDQYYPSDEDVAGDIQYFGYLNAEGEWYIQEYNVSAGTFRYATGTEDYSTNWTNRVALTYKLFNRVFI